MPPDDRLPGVGAPAPDWDEAARLFEHAVALAPAERAAFLDDSCGRDTPLRRELDSLLASHDDAPTFLDDVARTLVAPALEALDRGPGMTGRRVAQYEIRERIGAGGMGVVYRARDTRLERDVALKFLSPGLTGDAEARERLIREARAVSALDHPAICALYAIDETEDGDLFLAMPHYAGETLRARIARGPLPVANALDIAGQVADALAHAHAHGITHRDLKPANILVTHNERVKVLDFGVARARAAAALTRPGAPLGTAPYMAPEQVRGAATDARADLWALGVCLYEMLAGRRPFTGESDAAVAHAISEREPPPLQTLRADVPPAVDALVRQLLSKDPAARPADAPAVVAALRRSAGEDTLEAPGVHPARDAAAGRAPIRLTRRRLVLAAVAILALVLTGLYARSRTRDAAAPPADNPPVAVLPFSVSGDPALDYLGAGIVHLLSAKLNGAGELRSADPYAVLGVSAGTAVIAPERGRALAQQVGAGRYILGSVVRVGTKIELTASLYDAAGTGRVRATAMADDEDGLPAALDDLAQDLVAGQLAMYGGELASIAAMTTMSFPALRGYLEGEALLRAGRSGAAVAALQDAVAADSTFALAWYRLARAAGRAGPDTLNALAAAQAVRWADALPDRYRTLLAGYHAFRTGDPREAERLYRRVLADHPHDFEALELLGETLYHNNPYYGRSVTEARAPLEEAWSMDRDNRELLVHLMDIALHERRIADLDSLTALYLHPDSIRSPPVALHVYRALRRLVIERAAPAAVVRDLEDAGPDALEQTLRRVAAPLGDAALADALAAQLAATASDDVQRFDAYVYRARVAAATGRPADADAHWRAAEAIAAPRALVHRALNVAARPADAAPATVDALRARLLAWHPAPADLAAEGLGASDGPPVRTFLIALLDLERDDDADVTAAIAALDDARTPDTPTRAAAIDTGTLGRSLARTLAGLGALRDGRAEDALAAFDAALLPLPFHARERSPLFDPPLVRAARADALRRLGRPGGALVSW